MHPLGADAPIAAGVPSFKAIAGELPEGKALPVVRARLKIGEWLEKAVGTATM